MEKIKKNILADFNNYCLIKYLKKIQPQWTKVFAIKMISSKNVLVNNKKTKWNYRLKTGDIVELYGIKYENLPKSTDHKNLKKLKKLDVVYEDENLIIVNKETKISVQPKDTVDYINMNNRLLNHLNFTESKEKWTPTFIHRLDHNTTGLLIGAKNYKTYQELNNAQRNGKIKKYYKTIVHNKVYFLEKTLKNWLIKKNKKVYISETKKPSYKYAECTVRKIKNIDKDNSSLLEVELKTGRTHQIRAQLSHINHPIRGDQKYGIEKERKKYPYPALCAYKLHFEWDIEGENLIPLKNRTFKVTNFWFEDSTF